MDPKTDKLVRRTTMVATVTASYFLITADYGPDPNFLDPIKNVVMSAQRSVKEFMFGAKKESAGNNAGKVTSNAADKHP
ncbi:uncharacterized protein LOC127252604 [Andrographis paniculata]|uniref:uncharacterized protein LOC127252604 n=1 Tax=Andrographis paniculata TaxID=175694 RepID=UPI0021E8153B|nr:uncharacterized protein LOC127252604 [Andrographis paniculata]